MSKQQTPETQVGSPTPDQQSMRDRIVEFEKVLEQSEGQYTPELTQYFCHGVYMRQVFLQAGTLVTGRIHKHPCLNILLQGELLVVTEDGFVAMKAPMVFEAPAGVKRAAQIISDTIWITVHANPDNMERDSTAMADLLTVPSYDDLLEFHCSKDALDER